MRVMETDYTGFSIVYALLETEGEPSCTTIQLYSTCARYRCLRQNGWGRAVSTLPGTMLARSLVVAQVELLGHLAAMSHCWWPAGL